MNIKVAVVLAAVALQTGAFHARSELIAALTTPTVYLPKQSLITFTSDAPGNILSAVEITGLMPGESVLGIDVRPATGELYALTNGARLYAIHPNTGVALLRASLNADPADATAPFTALIGTKFGVDFNPQADRLRVVSDARQNLRINPATGATFTDGELAYLPGDAIGDGDPQIVDAAYTNNDTDASTPTTLFVLEQDLLNSKVLPDGEVLPALSVVRQGGPDSDPSPNLGGLTTVGAFGRDGVTLAGFDVGPAGKAFIGVRLVPEGGSQSEAFYALVKVLLAPEDGEPIGKDESLGYVGGGFVPFEDIAVIQSVQFDKQLIRGLEGDTLTITVSRHGGTSGLATAIFSTRSGSAVAGSDFLSASGTLNFPSVMGVANLGQDTRTFEVTLLEDGLAPGLAELDEAFQLVLLNSGVAALGGADVATVRISANDFDDGTGPAIDHFGLTGPSRGITGAVVRFNEDLDVLSATTTENYSLVGLGRNGRKVPIEITGAIYDPDQRTVTLTVEEFVQTDLKRLKFTARGKPSAKDPAITGITDLAGNFLNGNEARGKNTVLTFAVVSGTSIRIKDADGDRATISIEGGGTLDASVLLGKNPKTQFWILDPIPLRSRLSGTVRSRPTSNGIVVISEIIGLDKKEFAPLLTNTSFRVNTLTFSSNATGLP